MSRVPGIRRAFWLALSRRADREVAEEFAFHLEMRARALEARGWTPAAARAEALRLFGDVEEARTYCRRVDERRERQTMRLELLQELRQDAAFALRTLRKTPGFTAVAILTLALGIGANTAIFSVVRGILLRPLPFAEPARLVVVPALYNGTRSTVSPANFYDWRAENGSFTGMAALTGNSAVLTGHGNPERLTGFDASPDLFRILGVRALAGRSVFTPDEGAFQGPHVVLLRESLWRTRFGADPGIVGSTIVLDGVPTTVVGVVPDQGAWPSKAQMWRPLTFDPKELPKTRGAVYLTVVARLRPGVTLERADADMRAISRRLEQRYPESDTHASATVVPLREWIVGNLRTPLLVLLGAVGFVLLIVCANVANLFLVRAAAREPEIAVRTALGAGRARLVRQLVTESTVLSLIGGIGGVLFALWGTRALVRVAPASIPRLDAVHVDALVLAFTLVVSVLTGIVFGLIPARQVVRPDLSATLRESGRGSKARPGSRRARGVLVVSEVALAVMLLAGAGLLIRSFHQLTNVDPGFRPEHAVSFELALPEARYDSVDRQRAFVHQLTERLRAIPGVRSVGASFGLPLTGFGFSLSFEVQGRPPAKPGEEPVADVRIITPDYLKAMGIPIVRGRGFTPEDREGARQVVLVTEATVARFFPGEDPIGRHITLGWGRDGKHLGGDVIGVVGDVRQNSLAEAAEPEIYAPYDQWPVESFNVVMRGSPEGTAILGAARAAIRDIDPDLAMSSVRTLDALVAESVAQPRFYMTLLAAFAVVALLLSAIGIYGVIAYLVSQRAREIGIRIALGASREHVVRMVVRQGAALAVTGIAIGIAGALLLTRLMTSLLFGVTPSDPATFGAVVVVLGAVALLASWVPARRAARVDPALAMRAE
ncbi:MAG TPA: ABC transporter permease [Gemmatimonadaceae bacterium]